jgi:hypothetical protein|nr:MAG TPA: hypothetical protein [Caudoviricetes sp.]
MYSKIFNLYFSKDRHPGNNIISEEYFQASVELEGKRIANGSLKQNVKDLVKLHYGKEITEIEYSRSPLRDYYHLCTEELSHSELGKLYFDLMSMTYKGMELVDLVYKENGAQAVANFLYSAKYNYFHKVSIEDYDTYNPVPFRFFLSLDHKKFMPKTSQEMLFYKKIISPRAYGKFVALSTKKMERYKDRYSRYLNHYLGTEGKRTSFRFNPNFTRMVTRKIIMKDKLQMLDEWLKLYNLTPIQYYSCFSIKSDTVTPHIELICEKAGMDTKRFLYNALILSLEKHIANPFYGEKGHANPERSLAIQSSKFLKESEGTPSF